MIRFKVSRHIFRDIEVVEIWWKDRFIATVVPPPDGYGGAAVTIVSKHIQTDKVVIDDTKDPRVVMVTFDAEGRDERPGG